jgi:transcriptional regulator with XRE-family HTH domain
MGSTAASTRSSVPSSTTLIRIAEALEVPLADLFIGLDADKPLKLSRRTGGGGRSAIVRELEAVERSVQKMKALVSPPTVG